MKLKTGALALSFLAVTGCGAVNTSQNDWDKECTTRVSAYQGGRISLDIGKYAKDWTNGATFDLPTSCEKAEAVKRGDMLVDKFRWGSFIVELGSSSSWKLEVEKGDTSVKAKGGDQSRCVLGLSLQEDHFSINPFVHLKDWLNKTPLDWEVPCSVHDKVKVGHNFIPDNTRLGSLMTKGSVSGWALKVKEKKGPAQNP